MKSVTKVLLSALTILAPVAAAQQGYDYLIGPRDVLELKVLELPDLNVDRRVLDSGGIDLPLLGLVNVAGITAADVRDRIEAMLTAKFVNRATVNVLIKEYGNKPISVFGAVGRPGALQSSGRWTLQQAILGAGGLTSAGKKIFVLRSAENGLSDRIEVNTDEIFVRSSVIWNFPMYPGDIVTVPARTSVKVFCIGEFRTPGTMSFEEGERTTLLTLVAKTGGLTDRASKGKVIIKRRSADGRDEELVVSYSRILSGKDRDVELRNDDVVVVKESLF